MCIRDSYRQHAGRFYDVSVGSATDFPSNARGVVHADLDNDGDLDLVVNNYLGDAVVLRNNLQRNNWIRLRLIGTACSRDAIGARVVLHTNAGSQLRTVRGGSGFLSKEDNSVHFGLGEQTHIDKIEISWPSGLHQVITNLAVNKQHEITEARNRDGKEQPIGN